ncbi:hypothetical protein [Nitrosomonas sp. Nm166]|uniref:hypothetical protein n=1 Tax=Nitrosomonas sp. Nm166 TaxID=1881054 RepID=UPI0008ECEEE5|nr:hypothetical protein [Nitrosomonas sp. Nm166]SFF15883.1 hypothetical protein SAMN05428977_10598 [Nitrosomonas sp. Nm166]
MAIIFGTGGNDFLTGGAARDIILGFGGADRLAGGAGGDVLVGGGGGDILTGGLGKDFLVGGAGFDRFDYNTVAQSPAGEGARDVILDFDGNGAAAGDFIDLSTIDANLNVGGNQAFTLAQLNYNAGTGILSVNVFGDPGAVDLQIELDDAPPLDIVGVTNDIIL